MSSRAPTLPQLRAFSAVAEYLHFGTAAAELDVTQPALSAALTGCEEAVGARLVERTTRRVRLTETGRQLLPHARTVLTDVDAFMGQVHSAGAARAGLRRIGVIPTVAPYLLPPFLRAMASDLLLLDPRIHELQTADILNRIDDGLLDIGICALPAAGNVEAHPLYSESLLAAIPRSRESGPAEEFTAEQLADEDMLLLEEGHCLRDNTLQICQRSAAPPPGMLSSASGIPTLLRLVEAGLGIALIPETASRVDGRGLAVALRRVDDPAAERTIALVHRRGDDRAEQHAELAGLIRRVARQRRLPVRIHHAD